MIKRIKPFEKLAWITLAAVIIVLSTVVGNSQAAQSTGTVLTTSPISVDMVAQPGSSADTSMQVQNNSQKTLTILVELEKFRATGDAGKAEIYKPSNDDPSLSWVHFSRTSINAVPGVWNSVKMTVDVPKDAAHGYYYAVLFEPQTSLNKQNQNQKKISKIQGANAIFVLLNAKTGDENNKLSVVSFSSDKSVYQYLPARFSVKIHNNGNIHTAPRGDIFISRTKNGPTIASLTINKGQGNILPGTNRIFQAAWKDGFPSYQSKRVDGQIVSGKNGQPVQELRWNGNVSKLRFGKYYARLTLVYHENGHDVPVHAEVSFWVIPWLALLILVIILVLVGFGIWTVVRHSIKKVHKK